MFKESIIAQLKKNRPNLTDKSMQSYTSTLYNLPKRLGVEKSELPKLDIKWFKKNMKKVTKQLEDNVKPAQRKSILSAIYIFGYENSRKNEK